MNKLELINASITVTPNFPKEGIYFRDISQLLANNDLRETGFDMLADLTKNETIDYVAGIDSRGFIFGIALAQRLKCGFVMLRKQNKTLESNKNPSILSLQTGLIPSGKNVIIVDDILSSGGSVLAGCELIEKLGCNVVGCLCLIELDGSQRKEKLMKYKIFSLLRYSNILEK